jgi:hypothetical protein
MSNDEFTVEMPGGGGQMWLANMAEVDRWQTLEAQYREQYDLRKVNDLTNLGTLLVQQINLYRAQMALSGRVPEVDDLDGLPTGRMIYKVLKPAEVKAHQEAVTAASKEIREIEKAMGIDKKSREQAGDESLRSWLVTMKERAHRYGLHVSERTRAYEEFAMELRWRLRLNEVGDAEDKQYEDCSDEGVIRWAREQLAALEARDQTFAQEEGALVLGKAL